MYAVSHVYIQVYKIQYDFKCVRETFGPAKRDLRVVSVALISPDLPRLHASSPIGGPKVYADFADARSLPDLRCARCSNRLRLKHEIQSGSWLLPRFALSSLPNASVLPLVFSSRFCSLLSACLNCHSYILFSICVHNIWCTNNPRTHPRLSIRPQRTHDDRHSHPA